MVANVLGLLIGAEIDRNEGGEGITGALEGYMIEGAVKAVAPLLVTFAIGFSRVGLLMPSPVRARRGHARRDTSQRPDCVIVARTAPTSPYRCLAQRRRDPDRAGRCDRVGE